MIRTTTLLVALAASASAFAQVLPNTPHLTLEQRGAFLLTDAGLRQKLALPPAARTKIDARLASYAKAQDRLYSAKKPDESAIQKLDSSTAAGLLAALPDPQRKRLFQIAIRQAGASALVAPDVRQALKLTAAQVVKIEAGLEAAAAPSERLEEKVSERVVQAADDQERQAIHREYEGERKRLASLRTADEAKLFKILTPAQQKTWAALSK
ncbi:MAG: Spy/CpxP family protein refolding chaperone [Fimbriimonas sp.]